MLLIQVDQNDSSASSFRSVDKVERGIGSSEGLGVNSRATTGIGALGSCRDHLSFLETVIIPDL